MTPLPAWRPDGRYVALVICGRQAARGRRAGVGTLCTMWGSPRNGLYGQAASSSARVEAYYRIGCNETTWHKKGKCRHSKTPGCQRSDNRVEHSARHTRYPSFPRCCEPSCLGGSRELTDSDSYSLSPGEVSQTRLFCKNLCEFDDPTLRHAADMQRIWAHSAGLPAHRDPTKASGLQSLRVNLRCYTDPETREVEHGQSVRGAGGGDFRDCPDVPGAGA
ncbi:hypothetical protein CSE45_2941 [Citreicella sp. SE45]|nr:hypothetical protein CSE45_2941 [Citreicella sp. SE45]